MPRSRRRRLALLLVAALPLVLGLARAEAENADGVGHVDEAGWEGVLGLRPAISTGQRYVVVLQSPSLATRVRAAGGYATEAEERRWTSEAVQQQEQFLARLAAAGARMGVEYRFSRVVNGFSARLDPTSLELLERDREVAGVYPVRIAYPAQVGGESDGGVLPTSVADLQVSGLDGSGVTVALLDTGIDPSHPYLRDSLLPGIDVISPGSGGIAQPHPTIPGRTERHGTELAGIITGSGGPGGLHGIAPGALVRPIRVAGWQPNSEGGFSVYSRTDQILAGLEDAVDPNDDGDAHDAARIALVGVVEPYAAFTSGPLERAIDGAAVLDTLTVVPAGNDGEAGPGYGSISGPGGARDALTVAAADGRFAVPTVRLHVRAGLRVLFDGPVPLGGAPSGAVSAGVAVVGAPEARRGITGLFTRSGVSTVAGHAVLLPRSVLSGDAVDDVTSAGALAILVDGSLPAGAFSLDVPPRVPVVGIDPAVARELRDLVAAGVPVTASVGAVSLAERGQAGSIAAFSSRGLTFGGSLKPDVAAPGVSVPTSEPGRAEDGDVRFGTVSGTSAAAAVTAGVAALVAQGRPALPAVGLRGVVVGAAQRSDLDPASSGAGLVDLRTAVQEELYAEPATLSFGARGAADEIERTFRVHNASTRALVVTVGSNALAPKGVQLSFAPSRLRLEPGTGALVTVQADVSDLSREAGIATGELVLRAQGAPELHLPWVVAVPRRVPLISRVTIRDAKGRVSDQTPSVLSLVAGSVGGETTPEIRGVESLDIELWRSGARLGVLARRRELLPGRYSFGLTGRARDGSRLARGAYVIRIVAVPGDGTPNQSTKVAYVVR